MSRSSFSMTLLAFFLFLSSLPACVKYKRFQPPPDEYLVWSKQGESELSIKKIMLECGYPSPFGVRGAELNDIALMHLCMEAEGFKFGHGREKDRWCYGMGKFAPPACEFGVLPPKRDVSKRLDGEFCKKYPKAAVCDPPDIGASGNVDGEPAHR
jgi:hypothetical protein